MEFYTFKKDTFFNFIRVIKIKNKFMIDYIKYKGRYKKDDMYLEVNTHFEANQIVCDCFL